MEKDVNEEIEKLKKRIDELERRLGGQPIYVPCPMPYPIYPQPYPIYPYPYNPWINPPVIWGGFQSAVGGAGV